MLDEYCNTLTDSVQVVMAIRLCRIVLPVWNDYLKNHPEAIQSIHNLLSNSTKIQNAENRISSDFLEKVLCDLESEISLKKKLKGSGILRSHLATIMQPLTNPDWENTLTKTCRLVYTAVFNILAFLCLHRKNQEGETHIYVSINQFCDVIFREDLMPKENLERILYEYKDQRGSDRKG